MNNLCPGYMKTDLIVELLKNEGSHIEENWVKDIPMGRLGHPSELQGTVVWMASDASSYLNGSDIVSNPDLLCVVICGINSEALIVGGRRVLLLLTRLSMRKRL